MAVHVVVDPPVCCPDFPRRVEQTSEEVVKHKSRADSHSDAVNSFDDSIDNMRTGLEKIGP